MRVEAQPAYVLHARPWRETSLLVEVLTRDHGRIGLVARGLIGPKRQPLRAALQPRQMLRLDFVLRGELAQLVQAEALDAPTPLTGDTSLAAFYVHELLLRLTPRQDPLPALFELYARVRDELPAVSSLPWTLRRFERDLLDTLGYALPWGEDSSGRPVESDACYRLDAQQGPVRVTRRDGDCVSGAALQALDRDEMPTPAQLTELRPALRAVLASHLGPTGLRSWGLLESLAQVRSRAQS
jgi:DNA repair protein RecO (recombination protein O)